MSSLPPPIDPATPYRIRLVCMGNICRSPVAEVVLRAELAGRGLGNSVIVDSSGTGGWHRGDSMDDRAEASLAARGYDGSAHRARRFDPAWFEDSDLVLAMDRENLRALRRHAAGTGPDRLRLFRSFDPSARPDAEVPDPYYGGDQGFARVLDMVEAAARGLADELEKLPWS